MSEHRRWLLLARTRLRATVAVLAVALAASAGVAMTQESATAAPRKSDDVVVKVATFNLLGASHTDKPRRGFDKYPARTRRALGIITRRGFDIVGLQEYQWRQHVLFAKLTNGSWGVYPGLEHGNGPSQNSIIWRTDRWTLVEKHLYTIPYFYGKASRQPYVKLRNNYTGQEVWVINTHNPANTRGPAQRYRDRATSTQAQLATRLEATGRPVFLTGDFNDRDAAFCAITGGSGLKAANGGSWYGNACRPPRKMRIDWVFMSSAVEVVRYVEVVNKVTRRTTDHPVIFSEVRLPTS